MIYSFSFLAGQDKLDILDNAAIFDVRNFVDPAGLNLGHDGRDKAVWEFVTEQDGAYKVTEEALDALENGQDVAFGCAGGIYRSVSFATVVQDKYNAFYLYPISYMPVKHLGLEAWENGLEVWKQ